MGRLLGLCVPVYQLHAFLGCQEPTVWLSGADSLAYKMQYGVQTELSNAEAANSTAACTMLCDVPDMLTPLIQHAKAQLHTHSVTEALYRATKAAKTAADLPELDSAISAAQEAGLHELLSGPCRSVFGLFYT